jgi:xanthine dehydrogenase accessory factor
MSLQAEFFAAAGSEGRAALVTVVEPAGDAVLGSKLLVLADGSTSGSLGDDVVDADAIEAAHTLMWEERSELVTLGAAKVFVDVTAPLPRLFIFGAVDLAGALATAASNAGWRPFIIDPRARFTSPQRFPDAAGIVTQWPERAVAELGGIDRATYVAVITHDPKVDDDALSVALASESPYIGAMGSRRATADRQARLRRLGFGDEQLARISAPIGLDLGAVSPQETAVSIVAEMIAVRHGRSGGRLGATQARIHATAEPA